MNRLNSNDCSIISKKIELQIVSIHRFQNVQINNNRHKIRTNTICIRVCHFLYRRGALLYEKDRRLEYHISNTQIFTIGKRPGLLSSGQVFQEVLPVSGNGPTLQESMEPGKCFPEECPILIS